MSGRASELAFVNVFDAAQRNSDDNALSAGMRDHHMKSIGHLRPALRTIAIAVAGLALVGCESPTDAPIDQALIDAIEAAKGEIRTELDSYYRDLSARNWIAFASHFWPGATITTIFTPPGESAERVFVQTVPEFVALTPQGADSKPVFSERMLNAEIHVQGSLAQAWARYEAEFGQPGDIARWTGIDAFALINTKDDGASFR